MQTKQFVSKQPQSQKSIPPFSKAAKGLISLAITAHFMAIGLTYATNTASTHRSAVQDRVLTWLQPYLIGGNWYYEMLPIELYSDEKHAKHTWVSVQSTGSDDWKMELQNQSSAFDHAKQSQLINVLMELAINDDSEGLSRMMLSIVRHLESNSSTRKIDRIRLEHAIDETLEETESVVFEGTIARFDTGEIGLVPKIENRRSVKSLQSERGKP